MNECDGHCHTYQLFLTLSAWILKGGVDRQLSRCLLVQVLVGADWHSGHRAQHWFAQLTTVASGITQDVAGCLFCYMISHS